MTQGRTDDMARSDGTLTYSTPDGLVRDYASRGLVILAPEALGVPCSIHDLIYEKEKALFRAGSPVSAGQIPEVLDVINSPGVVSACNALLGEGWAIVPFTHNTPFLSGARDQHWHKDDNGPFNGRKQRHHQAIQVEMLYYPQAVEADMGPTATVPYSQYWTFNHEENQDNFAGADHLDFTYQIIGMEARAVSGPKSEYDPDDIRHRRTAHDIRMRDVISGLGWPLNAPFEAAPLRAGSVILYSHNLLHRGNHRRDDFAEWRKRPRFMWRFWLYRTTDPVGDSPQEIDWQRPGQDAMTGNDLAAASPDVTAVWRHQYHWLKTGRVPPKSASNDDLVALYQQLLKAGDSAEPARIGAAYRLAQADDGATACDWLEQALQVERESVRRAATLGLIALGDGATPVLLRATRSQVKWIRKAGVFGLGDASLLTPAVLDAVEARLLDDPSVYVRSVAAGSIGCLGRRAVATGIGRELITRCVEGLLQSLSREENRLGMDIAQRRSIKFVRPTDECDVCEGIGIDYGVSRFKPVRSAVRENALWSMVILCTHGQAISARILPRVLATLRDIVNSDANIFCVGFALDALCRLAQPTSTVTIDLDGEILKLLRAAPAHSWEPLSRSGIDASIVAAIEAATNAARRND